MDPHSTNKVDKNGWVRIAKAAFVKKPSFHNCQSKWPFFGEETFRSTNGQKISYFCNNARKGRKKMLQRSH